MLCAVYSVRYAVWRHAVRVHHCPVPWPVQFWWTVGALGFATLLVSLFLEDTTYNREAAQDSKPQQSYISDRLTTLFPGNGILKKRSTHGPLDPILIGVQPVALLAGLFLTITFAWAVALTTLLRFVYEPPEAALSRADLRQVSSCKSQ